MSKIQEDGMSKIRHPSELWQRDTLVVAVETIALAGDRVPLSYSSITVENRQITTLLFYPIAWANHDRGPAGRPTQEELRRAVATAHTLRPLSPLDLREGDTPLSVFQLAEQVFRTVAKHDSLIVTHAPYGLETLLKTVENWLGVDLPPLSVVDTAVLERARQGGLRQQPGESAGDCYQRIANVSGELPDLTRCSTEHAWPDAGLKPSDRGLAALATHAIYQSHFGGRLLRATVGVSDVR
jgi:hypothetical protein